MPHDSPHFTAKVPSIFTTLATAQIVLMVRGLPDRQTLWREVQDVCGHHSGRWVWAILANSPVSLWPSAVKIVHYPGLDSWRSLGYSPRACGPRGALGQGQ